MQPGGGPSGSSRSSPASSPRPEQSQPGTPASAQQQSQQQQLGFRSQVGLAMSAPPHRGSVGFEFILGGGFFFLGGRCDWWGTVPLRARVVVGIREKSGGRGEKAPSTVTRVFSLSPRQCRGVSASGWLSCLILPLGVLPLVGLCSIWFCMCCVCVCVFSFLSQWGFVQSRFQFGIVIWS